MISDQMRKKDKNNFLPAPIAAKSPDVLVMPAPVCAKFATDPFGLQEGGAGSSSPLEHTMDD
jgi:hypothetical protein